MLGFVKRRARQFADPYILNTLYIYFVRPILEYAVVICSSSYNICSDRIERIQKKFLIFALRRLPRSTSGFSLPPYAGRYRLLNLLSFEF